MSSSSKKGVDKFRIFAIILLIIGGSFFAFFMFIRFNPSFYRKLFLHASSSKPADLDPSPASTEPIISTEGGNKDYRTFMLDITAAVLSESGSSLNTKVLDPSKYGIDTSKVTEYHLMGSAEKKKLWEDYREKLKSFDYKTLSGSQQLSYDALRFYLDNKLNMADYSLFSSRVTGDISGPYSILSTLQGYSFDSEDDVAEYVSVIKNMNSCFDDIKASEKSRSEAGFFMPDDQADKAIDRITRIRENIASGSLKTSFVEKLAKVDISSELKDEYTKEHDKALNEVIIPGYDSLIEALKSYKGTNKYSGGLCNYPGGKEYFQSLIETYVGAGKENADSYFALIDSYLEYFYSVTDEISASNRNLSKQIDSFSMESGTTEELIGKLKERYTSDFTALGDISYKITPVEENLTDDTRAAFYSSPAIDSGNGGTVFINEKKAKDDKNFYETVAHETYPGHMYQTMFLASEINSEKQDIVRYFIHPEGFVEGWGIYSGYYAYDYTENTDRNLANLVKAYDEASMCLLGRADFMANYYGNSFNDINNFFAGYGYATKDVQEIYDYVIDNPGEYSKYCLGFLEIKETQRKAKDLKGGSYSDKSFNDFMIRTGPMAFSDIEKRIYTME